MITSPHDDHIRHQPWSLLLNVTLVATERLQARAALAVGDIIRPLSESLPYANLSFLKR
jgi:hypothetical protein